METPDRDWTWDSYRFTGRFTRHIETLLPNGSKRRDAAIAIVVVGLVMVSLWD